MKGKVLIRFRDKDGNTVEESVPIPLHAVHDAELIRQVNQEVAEKRHGKDNVISVELVWE